MIEKVVEVKLKSGLQARPAALFVQEATRFSSDIHIEKDEKRVNAKSIMGLMSLAIHCGEEISLCINGEDEEEAFQTLFTYVDQE